MTAATDDERLAQRTRTEAMADVEPIFSATGVAKRYPAVQALTGIDIAVHPGEVHALLGQNGAGKSTLVKIIAGAERPDAGTIVVGGVPLPPGEPLAAAAHRIAYVSQEGNLNPYFTVPENVFLGRERTHGLLLDRRGMQREVQRLLDEFGLTLNLSLPVNELDPAKRKLAEIVRALALRPRLLILDEPTAALPSPDVEHLLGMVRQLASRGIGILFISHYLDEVFAVCSTVTVLRDGRRVWSGPVAETDEPSLVRAMVGKDVAAYHRARERVTASGSPLLSANKLATRDGVIHDASLSVRAGTILGVFGVVGAGKSELLEAVFGMRPLASGSIQVEGRAHARWGPRQAIDAGLALVPEDRLRTALLTDRSIAWNVALPYWRTMRRLSAVAKQEGRIGQAAVKEIGIRAPSAKVLVANLSGGNKQKVSVGRWIGEHTRTRVFLFDEPTQGLDVGAREEVYILMRQLAERGAAIIVASSDLDELLALADEFVVMRSGTTAPIDPKMHNAEDLLAAAT